MKNLKVKNLVYLALAAIIWGFAFVAQSVGNSMGSFTFNCVRSIIGGLVLLPVIALMNRLEKANKAETKEKVSQNPKDLWKGGIFCGILLMLGSNLQQVGLVYTSAGKAGFITAMYIVLVPVAGIFLKRKCGLTVWAGVVLAAVGLYLLCVQGGFSFHSEEMKGNGLVFFCAFVFTAHILVVDHYTTIADGVKLSCIQFFTSGVLTAIPMLLFETPTLSGITSEPVAILYAGIMSCGVAYTFQILGQKDMNPTVCSLVLSLESAFAVLGGCVLLHERMGLREAAGCMLMFVAIVLAQLPEKNAEKEDGNGSFV